MSPVCVHPVGGTCKIFSVAVLLSQPQETLSWVRVIVLGVTGTYLIERIGLQEIAQSRCVK